MAKTDEQTNRVDGEVTFDHVIAAKECYGLKLAPGQRLRIIDIEGQQVMDTVWLDAADPADHLSVMWTNFINKTWKITKGHTLYSIRCNPLADIVEDTVGINSSTGGYCTEAANRVRFGVAHTRNCYDNLANALAGFGIEKRQIPEASQFCAFLNLTYEEDGTHEVLPPTSKAGDHIDFEARTEVLVGLSCCPQELNACNNFKAKPMRVMVYEKG